MSEIGETGTYVVIIHYDNVVNRQPTIRYFTDPGDALLFYETFGFQWSGSIIAEIKVGCELGCGKSVSDFKNTHKDSYDASLKRMLESELRQSKKEASERTKDLQKWQDL